MNDMLINRNPKTLHIINKGSYRVAWQDHLNIKKPLINGPGVVHGL